ncbi:MAG: sigma-70 family RNA polymerase sigma factor, partial [Mesorhizobium sp.]
MAPQDISKLIVRTSMKDRAAFDLLYKQTSGKLFGVCLRVLRDRGDAEEALQEVFVKIWTKADRFAVSDLSPISWLVAVARNHAIDRIRARRGPSANIDAALDVADPAPGPEAMAVAGGEAERIH